jgi:hypothetical protein
MSTPALPTLNKIIITRTQKSESESESESLVGSIPVSSSQYFRLEYRRHILGIAHEKINHQRQPEPAKVEHRQYRRQGRAKKCRPPKAKQTHANPPRVKYSTYKARSSQPVFTSHNPRREREREQHIRNENII